MAAVASVAEFLPPGVKFDPEDDVLVAHYLLPRLRDQPLPFDGIIIEADPLSAPPWKLLEKYRRKNDAFFFAAGQARSSNGSRQKRTCAGGGYWKVQKKTSSVDGEKLVIPGTGEEIAWRKYVLNFHADDEQGSTGWVMDEYAITAPSDLASASSLMAYHIRFSGHGRKLKREPQPQDSVADDEAGTTLPPLEDYPSSALQPVRPSAVPVDPEATPSEQGSSGVMDSAAFPENTHEPPFFADDLINSPAAGTSSPSWDAELDEPLLNFYAVDG